MGRDVRRGADFLSLLLVSSLAFKYRGICLVRVSYNLFQIRIRSILVCWKIIPCLKELSANVASCHDLSVLGEYKSHTLEIGNMSDLPAVAIAHVISKVSARNSWCCGSHEADNR